MGKVQKKHVAGNFFGVMFGILEEICLDLKFEIHHGTMDVCENRGTPQIIPF